MLLEESRISAEVVAQRGYRTVEDAQELHELGFADYQVRPPGLLIPVRGTGSEVLFSRFRPDTPRLRKNGKPAKYEQPQGTGVILDVPPSVQDGLRDVERRLWIGEGEKKADSLASLGEVAISILGV